MLRSVYQSYRAASKHYKRCHAEQSRDEELGGGGGGGGGLDPPSLELCLKI